MSVEPEMKINKLRVISLHPSPAVGGASISLTELLKPLVPTKLTGLIVTPAGSAAERFSGIGLNILTVAGLSQFDNTRYSRYRGVRWLVLIREFILLPGSLRILFMLNKRVNDFDLIHLNEITLLPLGVLLKRILKLPLVVHVRSLQSLERSGVRNIWVKSMLQQADAVVAIDESVRRTLPQELSVDVVHNVLNVDGITELSEPLEGKRRFSVAMVGGLLALKGVYEFIEAARICKHRGLDISFLIAGENARELKGIRGRLIEAFGFGRDVKADLKRKISKYGLDDTVELKGFVNQVKDLYRSIDLLCFPSHLNAAGRPVFEAAFFGVPSIVAINNPPADSLVHEVTGIAIAERDPVALADAIERLYRDKNLCRQMGERARILANENYSLEKNVSRLYQIFCRVVKR